ncbi:Outer membrane efflux protein BepC precursor [Jannaschia seosinensis]|uniref:Outer membrane efflux protein BepC n=1 Tax=Jannaschia seosinensis TaxID=313367 RepID=A0A0M7B6Z0_9RHOB|nr:TolC family outer membrane protein [Jannaschia seosinensis]CUH14128.1 Outer membrane efflux protein BepC precursor [Jannaschia seosinensis]
MKIVVAAALALIAAAPLQAETLSDTLVQAYRSSPILEQQRLLLRATDEDVAVAVSALRPTVNFQASYSKATTFTDLQTRTSPLGQTQQLGGRQTTTDGSLALVLEYTLVDGGQRALRLSAAKEAVLAARFNLVQIEQNVLLDAVRAYFDLRLAVQTVDVRESNVGLVTQQLQAAEDRFEVGEVTRTDVAIARARLSESQSLLAAARGDVDIARENYRLAVGELPTGTLAAPPSVPEIPPNVDRAQQLALQVHPLISSGQHDVAALTILAEAAAADRLPTIGLQGRLGRSRPDIDRASVGLTGNVPLYTGGRLPALQRRAIARAQAQRASLGQTARDIVEAVGRAWAGLLVARAQIEANEEGVRAARLAFDGFREEAQLGARTTLDVLNAEQDLLDARVSLLEAEAQAQLAIYNILAAIGLLTVDHLGLSVERYDVTDYYNLVSNAPQDVLTQPSDRGNRLDRVLRRFGRN